MRGSGPLVYFIAFRLIALRAARCTRPFAVHGEERIDIARIKHAGIVVEVDVVAGRPRGHTWSFGIHRQERLDVLRVKEAGVVVEVDGVASGTVHWYAPLCKVWQN